MDPVLAIRDLRIRFALQGRELTVVDGVDLDLHRGECLGIVGESGSGKSQSFLGVLGLVASNGRTTGSIKFQGEEILNAPRARLESLRGDRIAMIFQDASSGLTPNIRVGAQLEEVVMAHETASRSAARTRALDMLKQVNIPEPERRYTAYPFELSGGMRQRIMIALALICGPDVLICDEPTTALDVTVQTQILKLIDNMRQRHGTAVVFISHDLGVVSSISDRVLIMYGGKVIEEGDLNTVLSAPAHPYTQGLLRSIPKLDSDPELALEVIDGQPPDPAALPDGCRFSERCPLAQVDCEAGTPPFRRITGSHRVACLRVTGR